MLIATGIIYWLKIQMDQVYQVAEGQLTRTVYMHI